MLSTFMRLSLITYGLGNELKPELIKPIRNSGIKPKGGLWASPLNSNYGWKDWCEAESFGDLSTNFTFEFDGNVLIIDSFSDMKNIPWSEPVQGYYTIDFEKIKEDGFDAVFLTEKGQNETRLTYPRSLYGWDCESVIVLNHKRIITMRLQGTPHSRRQIWNRNNNHCRRQARPLRRS
jgi:hypothetical protein